MLLQHIIDIIEQAAPRDRQEEWDNSGLQVGNPTADVKAALLTVDVTESVVSYAVSHGFDLILSHHPLIFRGLKHLTGSTPQERCVAEAIRHNIAIYSAHTNLDKCGLSHRMAEALTETLGNPRTPLGNPIPLTPEGFGVIFDLPSPISANELLTRVKTAFSAPCVRYTQWNKPIRRVAMCSGSGAEFIGEAIRHGADAYLTADCKYHEFQAAEGQICLVDIDHWHSEQFARDIYKELLEGYIPTEICPSDRSFIHVWKENN